MSQYRLSSASLPLWMLGEDFYLEGNSRSQQARVARCRATVINCDGSLRRRPGHRIVEAETLKCSPEAAAALLRAMEAWKNEPA